MMKIMKNKGIFLIWILFLTILTISAQTNAEDTIKTYKVEKERFDQVNSIIADLRYMDLNIKPSKDQYAYLSYKLHCKNEKNPFTYNVKNGILNLKEGKWKGISWKSYTSGKKKFKKLMEYSKNNITLYLPKDNILKSSTVKMIDGNLTIASLQSHSIDLNFDYGDILLNDSSILGTLNIKAGDGDIYLKNAKIIENATITTNYGDITASNLQAEQGIEIKTNDGDTKLKNIKAAKNVAITTTYGDITALNFETKKDIKMKTRDGNIRINNIKASQAITINSYYGDITCIKLSTPRDIKIKTNDGNVKFQMKEKQLKQRKIIMDTTDGEMSIPSYLSNDNKKTVLGDGYHYEKEIDSKKSLLEISTHYGNISLS